MAGLANPTIGTADPAQVAVGRSRLKRITTPQRLLITASLVAAGVAVFGLTACVVTSSRENATNAIATQSEPLLVEADGLYASLSDADATAATTFLTGGIEPPRRRQRYLADLRASTSHLIALERRGGESAVVRSAVATIAGELPVYTGLVESARANNRQGLPVGAAYLRQASELMRMTILPAARQVYAVEARRLSTDYRSAVSTSRIVAVAITGALALLLLIASQLYLAYLSNRVFNLALLAASVLLMAVGAWLLIGFGEQQDHLSAAKREGSSPVEVLAATRILTLRAEADESLALVARGGGDQDLADFAVVDKVLGEPDGSGLVHTARTLAARTASHASFDDFTRKLAAYRRTHEQIAQLEANGRFAPAYALAVGRTAREAPLADGMNSELARQIAVAQHGFESQVDSSRSSLDGFDIGVPLLAVVIGLLALFGVGLRFREYR